MPTLPEEGSVLGARWRVVEVLAPKAQRRILRVVDEGKREKGFFALKMACDVDQKQQLAVEVHALRSLRHPHIVRLIDVAISEAETENDYFVMPMAGQGALSQAAVSGKDVVRFARQVASALAAAHEKEIAHRDVSLDNILVHENNVWLADFGLSLARIAEEGKKRVEITNPRVFAFDVLGLGKTIEALMRRCGYENEALTLLVGRMTCGLSRRIQTMAEVQAALAKV